MTPLQYSKLFWDDNILEHITHQTNLYTIQQSGKSIKSNAKEIEVFISIQMTMAIVKMSQYEMYWYLKFRCERLAIVMTVKRMKHDHDNDDIYISIHMYIYTYIYIYIYIYK